MGVDNPCEEMVAARQPVKNKWKIFQALHQSGRKGLARIAHHQCCSALPVLCAGKDWLGSPMGALVVVAGAGGSKASGGKAGKPSCDCRGMWVSWAMGSKPSTSGLVVLAGRRAKEKQCMHQKCGPSKTLTITN